MTRIRNTVLGLLAALTASAGAITVAPTAAADHEVYVSAQCAPQYRPHHRTYYHRPQVRHHHRSYHYQGRPYRGRSHVSFHYVRPSYAVGHRYRQPNYRRCR